jgi:hypothetical protein
MEGELMREILMREERPGDDGQRDLQGDDEVEQVPSDSAPVGGSQVAARVLREAQADDGIARLHATTDDRLKQSDHLGSHRLTMGRECKVASTTECSSGACRQDKAGRWKA